ncbi:hypothetical protein LWI29_005237 [Acer saccharum]|uniref:Uncharacterized protein n=1 Tax=Acer saccharum TaxID=4024 RepID=A0AA39RYF6_ACESA|nr:hypothetical protein LWI29_005237 [Acer saccharum]
MAGDDSGSNHPNSGDQRMRAIAAEVVIAAVDNLQPRLRGSEVRWSKFKNGSDGGKRQHDDRTKVARVVIDTGCRKNLVTKALVKKLNLPTEKRQTPYSLRWIQKVDGAPDMVDEVCRVPFQLGNFIKITLFAMWNGLNVTLKPPVLRTSGQKEEADRGESFLSAAEDVTADRDGCVMLQQDEEMNVGAQVWAKVVFGCIL